MANKKKRNPARPPSGPRPAAKRPGQPASASKAGAPKPGTANPPKPAARTGATKPAAKPVRERTGPTRSERLAAAEAARRRKAARTRALIAGGLVAVLALLTVTIINSRRSNDRVVSELEASGSCEYDSRNDSDGGQNRNHVNGALVYKVDPPSGGNHNPTAAPPGAFTAENTPPDAQIVHSLEHGYVAIWYRPDLDPAGLESLRGVANEYSRDVLLLPRATLSTPVAATAWHRRLICGRPDAEALERFITAYRNKGPEKVEH
ncbi:MAG: DUF3105 domain-containing protein [Acidimicrobiales bacterium]